MTTVVISLVSAVYVLTTHLNKISTEHFIAAISSIYVHCQYEEFKSNRKSDVTAYEREVPYIRWNRRDDHEELPFLYAAQ